MRRLNQLAIALYLLASLAPRTLAEDLETSAAKTIARVGNDIQYLASDDLGGRGVGTEGIATAADYVRKEFERLGLKSGVPDGGYYQHFDMKRGVEIDAEATHLNFKGPDGQTLPLKLGDQYQALSVGGSAEVQGELVFVGYGITGAAEKYDDYANIDVAGKIVVMIRREPQQDDENSPFQGKETSNHAYIAAKLALAGKNKAAAVIMVNDPHSCPTAEADELSPVEGFGGPGAWSLPFFHLKIAEMDQLLAKQPLKLNDGKTLKSIAAIERHIDATLQPVSQPLTGWACDAAAKIDSKTLDAFNVIGVLEGEGPLADETIVIGAHYDHLGMGGAGSRAPGRREIHNGADDNATGTAGVIELARRFAQRQRKPARRMVFIAFSGEESGLLGSAHYCENPLIPLEKTIAMVNFDMIGRLRNDKLTIYGVETGKELPPLVQGALDGADLVLDAIGSPFAGSDHLPFYNKKIPVLFVHTGIHNIYHTPEDDYETINVPGAVRVIDYTERLIDGIDALPAAPEFVAAQRRRPPARRRMPYLGIRPDYGDTSKGLILQGVAEQSPAEKAGLKTGDLIQTIDGKQITTLNEMRVFLQSKSPGDEIEVAFQRGGESKTVKVKLTDVPQ